MKLKSLFATATAAIAFGLAGHAIAQEATSTDVMPADAQPGPALWKLADEDTTIYLFGTVHVLPEGLEWYDGRIESAFSSADELVFEIDIDDAAGMQQAVLQKGMLEGDKTLRELMSEEDRVQYEEALAGFNMPAATFDAMEPWMAAMTLSVLPLVSAGYSPESGVEMTLSKQGADKDRGALETIEEQIGLFDSLPLEAQLTYLDETVEAIPETAGMVDQMVERWSSGDAVSLAELINDEMDDPAIYSRLLTDRNANWAEWIENRMATGGTVFIAVGAGHLAGEDSVQELLEARGLEVTRVWE